MKTDKQLLAMAMEALDHIREITERTNEDMDRGNKLETIKGRAKRMIEFIKKHQDENSGH